VIRYLSLQGDVMAGSPVLVTLKVT
jgi:hypothetical protein